ncbi:hypothetical protein VKT23_004416 [Stygiomarasmius scandens]|uniref:Uncharacterized protein n=1 Tax=Marasmiellus scandens TaxID=2682957 RepID=A0ABR1JZV1_9AGAR
MSITTQITSPPPISLSQVISSAPPLFGGPRKPAITSFEDPPPLPKGLLGIDCVYGYEITDGFLNNYKPFVLRRQAALTSEEPMGRVRMQVLYEAADELGLSSLVMQFFPGMLRNTACPNVTANDIVYFASATSDAKSQTCVAEGVLRQLEQKLGVTVKARWIAI